MRREILFLLFGAAGGLAAAKLLDAGFVARSALPKADSGLSAPRVIPTRTDASVLAARRFRQEVSQLRKELDEARSALSKKEDELKFATALTDRMDRPPAKGAQARTPEEVRRRLAEIPSVFEAAFQDGNGQQILALLTELGDLGAEAFPLLAECSARLNENEMDRLRIGRMAVYKVYGTEFLDWAFRRPDLAPELRHTAVLGLMYREPDKIFDRFAQALFTEKSPEVAGSILWGLADSNDERVPELVAQAAASAQDPFVRRVAVDRLSLWNTPESVAAVQKILASESDPQVLDAARFTMFALRPPATGVLVDWTRGTALKRKDLVVSVNGVPVRSRDDLRGTLPPGSRLQVLRDGSLVSIDAPERLDGLRARFVEQK